MATAPQGPIILAQPSASLVVTTPNAQPIKPTIEATQAAAKEQSKTSKLVETLLRRGWANDHIKKIDVSMQRRLLPKNFQDALKELAPALAKFLSEIPDVEPEPGKKPLSVQPNVALKALYNNQQSLFENTLETALVYAVGNIVKKIRPRTALDGSRLPIEIDDVATYLKDTIELRLQDRSKNGLGTIGEQLARLEKPQNKPEQLLKDDLIVELFDPILITAFPQKMKELVDNPTVKLNINFLGIHWDIFKIPGTPDIPELIWDGIRIPQVLTNLYNLLTVDTGLAYLLKPASAEMEAKESAANATATTQGVASAAAAVFAPAPIVATPQAAAAAQAAAVTPQVAVAKSLSKYLSNLLMDNIVPGLLDKTMVQTLAKTITEATEQQIALAAPAFKPGIQKLKDQATAKLEEAFNSTLRNNSRSIAEEALVELEGRPAQQGLPPKQGLLPAWCANLLDSEKARLIQFLASDVDKVRADLSRLSRIAGSLTAELENEDNFPSLKSESRTALIAFEAWYANRIKQAIHEAPHANVIWKHVRSLIEESIFRIFFDEQGNQVKSVSDLMTKMINYSNSRAPTIHAKRQALNSLAQPAINEPEITKAPKLVAIAAAQKDLNDEFLLLANDFMMECGLDKNKKFLLLFDPMKALLADLLATKVYPALLDTETSYAQAFDRFCSSIYDQHKTPANQGADAFTQALSNPALLTQAQRDLLWKTTGVEEAAKHFEVFIRGLATPLIRKGLQSFLKTQDAAQLTNSTLELGLKDPAALAHLQQEIQTVTLAQTPAMSKSWSYAEDVLVSFFLNAVPNLIHSLQPPAPQPILATTPVHTRPVPQPAAPSHKLTTLPQQLMTELATWVEQEMKANTSISAATTVMGQKSFDELLRRERELERDLRRPQLLVQRFDVVKTKLKQQIHIFHAKFKVAAAAANALPRNQKRERAKLIADVQVELLASEANLKAEIANLESEMKLAQQNLAQHAAWQTERQQIRAEMQDRYLNLAFSLRDKLGSTNVDDPAHPMYSVPLPTALKKHMWDNAVPTILAEMMTKHMPTFLQDASPLKEISISIFNGHQLVDLSEGVDKFTESFIQHMLATDQDLSKALFEVVKDMIPEGLGKPKDLKDFMEKNAPELVGLFTNSTQHIGQSQNAGIKKLWSMIGSTGESFSLKILTNLSKLLLEMQAHDSQTFPKIGTRFMLRMSKHADAVNLVTSQHGVSHPHLVPADKMLQGMRQEQQNKPTEAILHPALQEQFVILPNGTKRLMTTEEARMEKFIKPMVKRLLALVNIKSSDFANPQIFDYFQDQLAPLLMQSMFSQIMSPSGLRSMHLTLVKNMENVCEDLERGIMGEQQSSASPTNAQVAQTDSEQEPSDSTAKEMAAKAGKLFLELAKWVKTCIFTHTETAYQPAQLHTPTEQRSMDQSIDEAGKLLHSLLNWLPGTVANAFLSNSDSLKKMTAEQLGQVAYNYNSQMDVIHDSLKKMIQASASSLDPSGRWVGDRFRTAQTQTRPTGEIVNVWKFQNVITPHMIQKQMSDAKRTENAVLSGMRSVGNKGFDITVWKTINGYRQQAWDATARTIEIATETILPKCYTRITQIFLKAIVGTISGLIIFTTLLASILAFGVPYWIFTRLHIYYQINHLDKSLAMPVHHSLVMHCMEDFVTSMERAKAEMATVASGTVEPTLDQQWNQLKQESFQLHSQFSSLGLTYSLPQQVPGSFNTMAPATTLATPVI